MYDPDSVPFGKCWQDFKAQQEAAIKQAALRHEQERQEKQRISALVKAAGSR